jgi:hypothetical protein
MTVVALCPVLRQIRIVPKQELSSSQNVRPCAGQDFLFDAGVSGAGILDAAI